MEKSYLITQDQLETIRYHKQVFNELANTIQSICSEKKDAVTYGFDLGIIYSRLSNCYIEMMQLEDEIKTQIVTDKNINQIE